MAWLIATFFGVGHFPFASGTAATAAAVPLYAGYLAGGDLAVLVLAVLSTFAGVAAAAVMEQRLGYPDPPKWSSTRSRDSWSRWSFCR